MRECLAEEKRKDIRNKKIVYRRPVGREKGVSPLQQARWQANDAALRISKIRREGAAVLCKLLRFAISFLFRAVESMAGLSSPGVIRRGGL